MEDKELWDLNEEALENSELTDEEEKIAAEISKLDLFSQDIVAMNTISSYQDEDNDSE